jgi:glycosyltransferase involved in cell wall biosynthesis
MTSHRPHVLLFTTQALNPYWGGSERFWYEIVTDRRFGESLSCTVLMQQSSTTSAIARQLNDAGIAVRWFRRWSPGLLQRGRRRLMRYFGRPVHTDRGWWRRLFTEIRADLAWFNLADLEGAVDVAGAASACQDIGIPYFLVVQGAPEHFFMHDDARTAVFAEVITGARRVYYVSERNRHALERAVGRRLANLTYTPNALSRAFLAAAAEVAERHVVRQDGTARFLSMARFEPLSKGQHILLEILADRAWQERDWSLLLQGGGGRLEGGVRRLVSYYGVGHERVRVDRSTADAVSVLAQSDLLIMPSLVEGTPFAMVEAMACGRPAVGTPVGGIPELILDGRTGWLAASTERQHVAEALERAWSNRALWEDFGLAARQHVTLEYNQDHSVPAFIERLTESVGASRADGDERPPHPGSVHP